MITLTKPQRNAIMRSFSRSDPMPDHPLNKSAWLNRYKAFRKSVGGTFGCDGAVVVQWAGMWLCIEKDGYTHT